MSSLRILVLGCALSIAAGTQAASQSIEAKQNHTCALSAAGELYCWGMNVWQPGSRIRSDSTPMPIVDSTRRYVAVGVGWLHDCAVDVEGRVWCAGVGSSGELGRDPKSPCELCGRRDTISSPLRFRSVVTGQSHSCALTLDRRAYCWGSNDAGQVGTGDRVETVYWPTAVVGGRRWLSLVAGTRHTCGLTTDERVFCWGANSTGALGYDQRRRPGCRLNDPCMAVPYPIADTTKFSALFAGANRTCGLTKAAQLHCWGGEFNVRFGRYARGVDSVRMSVHLATSFAVKSVALAGETNCVLAVGGDVYCWTEGNPGPIGGAGIIAYTPRQVSLTNRPVNTTLKFVALTTNGEKACGIATDGGAYCWGKLDIPAEKLPCANPLGCTALPYRVAGALDLLKPSGAKR